MPKENTRYRNWTFVFYPDSAPENFEEIIASWHVEAFLSPLHEHDKNPDGTLKKPHYHVLLCFTGKKSLAQIQEYSNQLSGVTLFIEKNKVADKQIMVRYLVHYDNPEKHQYNIADIKEFGGADMLSYFLGEKEDSSTMAEMMKFCVEQGITSFATLSLYAAENRPEWFRCLTTRRTYFMTHFLKSLDFDFRNGKNHQ